MDRLVGIWGLRSDYTAPGKWPFLGQGGPFLFAAPEALRAVSGTAGVGRATCSAPHSLPLSLWNWLAWNLVVASTLRSPASVSLVVGWKGCVPGLWKKSFLKYIAWLFWLIFVTSPEKMDNDFCYCVCYFKNFIIDWFNCVYMCMLVCGVWIYLHRQVVLCVMCVTVWSPRVSVTCCHTLLVCWCWRFDVSSSVFVWQTLCSHSVCSNGEPEQCGL